MASPIIEVDSASPGAVDGRQIRAISFQAVRMEYVAATLDRLGLRAEGKRAVVIGGGRGLLALGLAQMGMDVVSVDPSPEATAMAKEAAEPEGHLEFRTAPAEDPGLKDGSFDIAFYADTFEITDRLDQVVGHAARLLRPEGVLFYDTVNRTPVSRLIYLGLFQRVPMTRIMPKDRYVASRLRTPDEIEKAFAVHGLSGEDVTAFKPKDPRTLVRATLARRKGKISDEQIPPLVDFVLGPDGRPIVTYLGFARFPHGTASA